MDDEFKLCWKNFQDNIASGFQNLYDRGDLVDVTLACDGKLLHAHKIVLAICSPYFQEIFITNPCKHPIIILKDVSFNIMCELLEFMYQGVVNVKHTELQSFMKIGQLLQIKGLATNSSNSTGGGSGGSTLSEKSSQAQSADAGEDATDANSNNSNKNNNSNATDMDANPVDSNNSNISGSKGGEHATPARTPSNIGAGAGSGSVGGCATSPLSFSSRNSADHHTASYTLSKRAAELNTDSLSIYSRKQVRRSHTDHHGGAGLGGGSASSGEQHDNTNDASMEQLSNEEFFLPHISMVESRYDLGGVKRENEHHGLHHHHHHHGATTTTSGSSAAAVAAAAAASVVGMRNPFGPAFSLDYNFYKNNSGSSNSSAGTGGGAGASASNATGTEYPNELYMPNDYTKNFGNHMDIPPIAPGEHWFQGKLEFMLSQRGKPLLVHDGHTFGIQYVRKDKKYWQCNLSRKFNCKARVTTTDTGEIIVTNNEHCHTEIRQHLRKDYQRNKVMMNAIINMSNSQRFPDLSRHQTLSASLGSLQALRAAASNLKQSSPIEEVVQNLHDLAKATAAAQQENSNQQQQQQQQLQQHEREPKLQIKDDDLDEPLDCGIKHTLEDVARNLMTTHKAESNELNEMDWPSRRRSNDFH